MNVTEAITASGITPSPSYTGAELNDDYILAVKTDDTQKTEKEYTVVADHIKGYPASLNPKTNDSQFIRTGICTAKTSVQRSFSIEGERVVGDAFQDFCLANKMLFGTGQDVVMPYVYFSIRTGKGETGTAALIVSEDGSGNAGEAHGFKVDMKATGKPADYTYTAV